MDFADAMQAVKHLSGSKTPPWTKTPAKVKARKVARAAGSRKPSRMASPQSEDERETPEMVVMSDGEQRFASSSKQKQVVRPYVELPLRQPRPVPTPKVTDSGISNPKRTLPDSPDKKGVASKRARTSRKRNSRGVSAALISRRVSEMLDLGKYTVNEGQIVDPKIVPLAKEAVRGFGNLRENGPNIP